MSCTSGCAPLAAAPYDAGLFRRRRFASGLGGTPFVLELAISRLLAGVHSLVPANRVSERLAYAPRAGKPVGWPASSAGRRPHPRLFGFRRSETHQFRVRYVDAHSGVSVPATELSLRH